MVLSSVAELNGKEGFVIAPFSPSCDCPVLLIHPDESRLLAISDERAVSSSESELEESIPARDIYAEDFECFHRELEKGTFRKIVLARKATLRMADKDFEKLFMKACRMYPRLFVALVYTPQSGMWLMATPEILLKGEQGKMQTMSLASNPKGRAFTYYRRLSDRGCGVVAEESGGTAVCNGLYRRLYQGFL